MAFAILILKLYATFSIILIGMFGSIALLVIYGPLPPKINEEVLMALVAAIGMIFLTIAAVVRILGAYYG
jgi:hypothetical protein